MSLALHSNPDGYFKHAGWKEAQKRTLRLIENTRRRFKLEKQRCVKVKNMERAAGVAWGLLALGTLREKLEETFKCPPS